MVSNGVASLTVALALGIYLCLLELPCNTRFSRSGRQLAPAAELADVADSRAAGSAPAPRPRRPRPFYRSQLPVIPLTFPSPRSAA
jgi:hypothetical protein